MTILHFDAIFADRALARGRTPRGDLRKPGSRRTATRLLPGLAMLAGTLMLSLPALAIDADGRGQGAAPQSTRQQAIQQVAADRGGVIERILRRRPGAGPLSNADELKITLRHLSDGQLADALLANDAAGLKAAVLGKSAGPDGAEFLGNSANDLVYTPLPVPCRLLDTRKDSRGSLAKGETRAFAVQGSLISNQGGETADCPDVPFDPPAVVVALTAVGARGTGEAFIWAFGNPKPKVSEINYRDGINITNTTIASVCQNCGSQQDINIKTSKARSQVVGSIIGYFERPQGCLAGTTEIAGQCFQTALRSATNLFTATGDCEGEGGRLPTAAELLLALNTVPGTAAGEHTGTIYNADVNNGSGGFRDLRITSAGTLVSASTLESAQYRCVFDRFEFN